MKPPPVIRHPPGQLTVIETGPDVLLAAFVSTVALTIAVSVINGQLEAFVTADTMTCFIVPCGMLPKLQVSTLPASIAHGPSPVATQVTPFGRSLVRTTLLDVPGPNAVTTMS